MKKKESNSYNISVEGENCETLYFEHLAKIINDYEPALYKAHIFPKKKNPLSFAKSRINIYSGKSGNKKPSIKYFHIQDIEDYYDSFQKNKFEKLIDEIDKAKEECNIGYYKLGYSNFSFDLWIALHKIDMNFPVNDRHQYYRYINKGFKTNFQHMDDYKSEDEFKKILSLITLKDVIDAVKRAKKIRKKHEADGNHLESYKKFKFYKNNPDLTVNEVVEEILNDCGISTE